MNLPSRTEFFGACWSHYFAITVLAHLDCHCRSKGFVMNPTQPKTLRPQPKTLRPGFTILEVVVVIAVISVLMAILVPAVQSARESSRRISCQNNLRQLGLALACTAEQSGTFPVGQIASKPFVELLPFLEQTALFNRLRSNIRGDVDLLPVFCCPSDPVIWAKNKARYGDTSYLLNRGTLFPAGSKQLGETNGFVVSPLENTRPADISDGLSNTVAMSERLAIPAPYVEESTIPDRMDSLRHLWWTELRFVNRGEETLAADQAIHHRTSIWPSNIGGLTNSYICQFLYDHILPPNTPGSRNGPDDYDSSRFASCMIVPPSSLHPGIVLSLLADGSVRPIGDSIDMTVWHALGTRNGGDVAAR